MNETSSKSTVEICGVCFSKQLREVVHRCDYLMYRPIGRYRRSKHRKSLASFNMMRHLPYLLAVVDGELFMQKW